MVIRLINEEILDINIEIIINRNLFKKNIIDENTYCKANEKLLKKLAEII